MAETVDHELPEEHSGEGTTAGRARPGAASGRGPMVDSGRSPRPGRGVERREFSGGNWTWPSESSCSAATATSAGRRRWRSRGPAIASRSSTTSPSASGSWSSASGPLFHVPTLHERVRAWREVTENEIELHVGDLTDYAFVESVIDGFRPGHDRPLRRAAVRALLDDRRPATRRTPRRTTSSATSTSCSRSATARPETHLVKLGTMGEYGTPDIDIEEGYLTVDHKGRSHTFLYPKTPGSMYHLSKVHDSHNIHFATRIWGLRATDLNQGVVYGVETDESALDPRLATSFHYDEVFGTALNRFCVQAVIGAPAHGLRQGRPDPRLPQHPRHDPVRRARRRQPGRARRAARLQPVHRAVQRARARRAGEDGRRAPRLGRRRSSTRRTRARRWRSTTTTPSTRSCSTSACSRGCSTRS